MIVGYWAAAAGSIEGLIYLRPEFTAYVHLKVQAEIVAQGAFLGILVAWWMGKD